MTDRAALQVLFDAGGRVDLEPRRYHLDGPLVIPPDRGLTVNGAGMGISELYLVGAGDTVILANRDRPSAAVTLRDFSVNPGGVLRSGAAIQVTAPTLFQPQRGHSAEFVADRIEVQADGVSCFAYGFNLDKLTCPKVSQCWIAGRFADVTSEALDHPGAMLAAIFAGGAQEPKILNNFAACARQGVVSSVPSAGAGEGIEISSNAMICINETVVLYGEKPGVNGGWATPWAAITRNHLFYLRRAVVAIQRSDLVIADNSLCGSHLRAKGETPVGIHLAACQNVRIHSNSFWNPSLSQAASGYGMAIDGCTRGSIVGNIIDPSVMVGAWFPNHSGTNVGWHAAVNEWGSATDIIDQVGNPLVLPC